MAGNRSIRTRSVPSTPRSVNDGFVQTESPNTSRSPALSASSVTTRGPTLPSAATRFTISSMSPWSGAGFGGLLIGARCKQLGVDNVRLIDKAADVGGTWYWNRYPGIACDVESYVYMPLLEELGYIPTEKYAKGPEIWAHCRRIAEHYDLYRDACLQTEVQEIRWESTSSRWVISTDRGDEIRARFVAMANGYLQKPKLPGIDGITNFNGHAFHTSRWDYGYTGDDLSGLSDKRVGHRRHRRDGHPVRTATGRGGRGTVRVPAHPVDCGCSGQPADRTGLGRLAGAGLAAAANGELPNPHRRRDFRRGSGGRCVDQPHQEDADRQRGRPQRGRAGRLRQDGRDPCAGRLDRDGRRHRRGAQAVVRVLLQAALFPRRIPAGVQPRQRHAGRHARPRASTRSPRPASSSPMSNIPWTV